MSLQKLVDAGIVHLENKKDCPTDSPFFYVRIRWSSRSSA